MSLQFPLITVLGPTAVGKTIFAAHLAHCLNAEILSADSRQVFRGMDIGTGKDIGDYFVDGQLIPFHLIDIADAGTEYSVYRFQLDFQSAYKNIVRRGKIPVLCGGTGLYIESILKGYDFYEVPVDEELRQTLDLLSDAELISMLSALRPLHATTDTCDRSRLLRAIEIESHQKNNPIKRTGTNFANTPVFGIRFERKTVRQRITDRLTQRLNVGMIEEVEKLISQGISAERLKSYGLEYKYIAMFLSGELNYNDLFRLLNTAIHQFAKRQMTWFRRMESKGINIIWLDGEEGLQNNLNNALFHLKTMEEKNKPKNEKSVLP